jgi:N-glycosidase YbiA
MITKFKGTWLSNFWPVQVALEGMEFPSVEHAYVAAKTLDPQVRERIRQLPTAADAKRFGRKIGKSIPFRPAWNDEFRIRLMRDLLSQKFTSPHLRKQLIATADEMLIESGHWHDVFFGICSCPKCGGRGQNWLGVLLMEIRQECRLQDASITVTENWRLPHAA